MAHTVLPYPFPMRKEVITGIWNYGYSTKRWIVLISVIVSTYNRPDALSLVLQSLNQQTDTNFEIIVADDGSKNDTKQLVGSFKSIGFQPLTHVCHEDTGFRLAAIRNLAATYCTGEYFIFLDVYNCFLDNIFKKWYFFINK